MTTIRLAFTGSGSRRQVDAMRGPFNPKPAILVSYHYIRQAFRFRSELCFRDWVLDSGAYSAHNSGIAIKLDAYIDACKAMLDQDPELTEVFALDVIGDWRASLRNTEAMWKAGVPAVPCYHAGEPSDVLVGLARDYPKIALGGLVGLPSARKLTVIQDAFQRVWPKRIHGFGLADEKIIMTVPFETVDATSWEVGPAAFGRWRSLGLLRTPAPQDISSEVRWFLGLERKAKAVWRREMLELQDPRHHVKNTSRLTGLADKEEERS